VVRVWWMLVAHLFLCIAIALIMTRHLDGYLALDNAAGSPWELGTKRYRLRVSEVTTILSTALVVVRICVSGWTAVTVWRCAFMLMEEGKVKLSQLSNMMVFRIPFSRPKTRVGWVVISVILLLFPQPFIGPLVTGAVGWSASRQWVETAMVDVDFRGRNGDSVDSDLAKRFPKSVLNVSNTEITEVVDRLDWTALVSMPHFMRALPLKGAGLASTMWEAADEPNNESHPGALCRQRVAYEYLFGPIPIHSTVYGSDLPCISIENIRWQRPPEAIKNMTSDTEAISWFSIFNSTLLDYHIPGAAILFDPQQPTLQDLYLPKNHPKGEFVVPPIEFPKPEIFHRSLSLLILLDVSKDCEVEALENTTIYGPIATILPPNSTWPGFDKVSNMSLCYAYATVEVISGVVNFDTAEFISSYTMQSGDSTSRNLSEADFKPESWVRPAMMLLPDVMTLVSITNTSQIPTWGNLQGYVETLIRQSYLASWGILRPFKDTQPSLFVSKAEPRLLASVNMWRLWGWFIINMFVPLSGFIWYFGAQWRTTRKLILDGPLTALLTPVQLGGEESGTLRVHQISTMTKYNEAGRISLPPGAPHGVGEGYCHAVLDISAKETGA